MGYTHYWDTLEGTDLTPNWKGFKAEARLLINHYKDMLAGWDGKPKTKPVVSYKRIVFNGIGSKRCETFSLTTKPSESDFCKTNREPYDAVVCAVLLLAYKHFNKLSFTVSSDGDPEDWQPAVEVCKVLGLEVPDINIVLNKGDD